MVLVCLLVLTLFLFRKRGENIEPPKEPPALVPEMGVSAVETPAPPAAAKVESKQDYLKDTHVEEADPEMMKENRETALRFLESATRGLKRSLELAPNDEDIKNRLKAAERFTALIESIDPNNKSTWGALTEKDQAELGEVLLEPATPTPSP